MRDNPMGTPIRVPEEVESWIASKPLVERDEPFTFTVNCGGILLLAPRRSEHVACAGGHLVLAAGEISFSRHAGAWQVSSVSNYSTGYCPDLTSWAAVRDSIRHIGIGCPSRFTESFTFRRCIACLEINVVKDSYFFCALCETDLPFEWNVDEPY
ncbi:hypothetical protein [Streptomyces sp. KR55]|uniref:hypothetical protein n=1 Tax=Streptomyces sp. KR55 TaxID=3457425 RepID=UPI003FCEF456